MEGMIQTQKMHTGISSGGGINENIYQIVYNYLTVASILMLLMLITNF